MAIANSALTVKLLEVVANSSGYYTKRAAAARNISQLNLSVDVDPLIQVLQEKLPSAQTSYVAEVSRQWIARKQNFLLILRLIDNTRKFYAMRIAVVKALANHDDSKIVPALLLALNSSFRIDPINMLIRRTLFFVPTANRLIINKRGFELNAMKVGFQKSILQALGNLGDIRALSTLFRLYFRGTSRLWEEALRAINRITSPNVTEKLFELIENHEPEAHQYPYLVKLFENSDIIPFLSNSELSTLQLDLIREILIDQGPQNLEIIEFIRAKTENPTIKKLLNEIISKITPLILCPSGMNITL